MSEESKLIKGKAVDESTLESVLAPQDKGNVVYWSIMLYGFAVLLPWNAVLNSLDFFILTVSYFLFQLLDAFKRCSRLYLSVCCQPAACCCINLYNYYR